MFVTGLCVWVVCGVRVGCMVCVVMCEVVVCKWFVCVSSSVEGVGEQCVCMVVLVCVWLGSCDCGGV